MICAGRPIDAVRAALVAAGAQEASEEAAEVVRIERGRPRYGVDMTDATMPQEAGINDRAVSFTKGCYVGQEHRRAAALPRQAEPPLRGLRLTEPADPGDPVVLGEKAVGVVSSAAVSPTHGPIALALVRREAEPGAEVLVGSAPAVVAEPPSDERRQFAQPRTPHSNERLAENPPFAALFSDPPALGVRFTSCHPPMSHRRTA